MQLVSNYFPDLSDQQKQQFALLEELYPFWNEKINVISRKDIEQLSIRHVLHSLAIAKVINFEKGTKVLDIGTGGGFPGIPLAILFPEVQFYLVDSIAKKISVVNEVIKGVGLKNCTAKQIRAEKVRGSYDFIVSRAVAPAAKLLMWTRKKVHAHHKNTLKNGYLFLKGGDLTEELKEVKQKQTSYDIAEIFDDSFFETKKIIYIPMHPKA